MKKKSQRIKLIECPRDAMQGITDFIDTDIKIAYINRLLKCGFDTLDFGSFVSPRAIPQLKDTADVLAKLELNENTDLLAIVGNLRGAKNACKFEEIKYLGFPFSISEIFLQRNINSNIKDSLERISKIQGQCMIHGKEMVIYISMGFGNPYDEPWDADVVIEACRNLHKNYGVNIISLSDTIGSSTPESIKYLFSNLIPELRNVEFGAHLHTTPDSWEEKIHAAVNSGCTRIDGALKGYGGCPMAKDDLTGNMPTENIVKYMLENDLESSIELHYLKEALEFSAEVFLH